MKQDIVGDAVHDLIPPSEFISNIKDDCQWCFGEIKRGKVHRIDWYEKYGNMDQWCVNILNINLLKQKQLHQEKTEEELNLIFRV